MGKKFYIFQQNAYIWNLDNAEIEENHLFYALCNEHMRVVEENPALFFQELKEKFNGLAKKIVKALDAKKETVFVEDIIITNAIPPGLKEENEIRYSKTKLSCIYRNPLHFIDISILKGEAKRCKDN